MSVRHSGDERYRITRQSAGHWLWCDSHGNSGGDNIDLVREIEPNAGYAEAVYQLTGASLVKEQTRRPPPPRQPPVLPPMDDQAKGRSYLRNRSISMATIEAAEQSGLVRYTEGAVLFVGYDAQGKAQNVTRRATNPKDPIQKRDLRGSDKSYPPMLQGDPSKVWIVEGGADALALHDIALRKGQQPPTILVSGGANVRSFLERAEVQAIIRRAEKVTIAGENEKSPEVQERADAGHARQAQRVAEISGRPAHAWKPQAGIKDVADFNHQHVQQERERSRPSHSYSRGPSMGGRG